MWCREESRDISSRCLEAQWLSLVVIILSNMKENKLQWCYLGGKSSRFNNIHDRDEYDEDGVRMFQVRCASGETDARATQAS